MTIGLITDLARQGEVLKRKKRDRERAGEPEAAPADEMERERQEDGHGTTAAHDVARAGMDAMERERLDSAQRTGGDPGDGAGKAFQDQRGIHDGPGHAVRPGDLFPEDAGRPYIAEGHGAPAPGVRHADLSQSRAEAGDLAGDLSPARVPDPRGAGFPSPMAPPADGHGETGRADQDQRGIDPGPAHPVTPAELYAQDIDRPYLDAGHAAGSPSNTAAATRMPAGVRHLDMTRSRGMLTPVNPSAPTGPGGGR
jgi:hypothetical protein